MTNAPDNLAIPKVLTEILQHVVFKMTDPGPHYSSVVNGDHQRWKIQCSKCNEYMSDVEYDLPICFAICPMIILLHNGLVHSSFLDFSWFDEAFFHKSALQYLFSSFEAYKIYTGRFHKETLAKSPNEKDNQTSHFHVDEIEICQYCSGHYLSSNNTSAKVKIDYVRHISNFIGANKEDSGHMFLNEKKKMITYRAAICKSLFEMYEPYV